MKLKFLIMTMFFGCMARPQENGISYVELHCGDTKQIFTIEDAEQIKSILSQMEATTLHDIVKAKYNGTIIIYYINGDTEKYNILGQDCLQHNGKFYKMNGQYKEIYQTALLSVPPKNPQQAQENAPPPSTDVKTENDTSAKQDLKDTDAQIDAETGKGK